MEHYLQTPDIQDRPAAPPGRRLTQNNVRLIALALLTASLLSSHLASPQTAHGQDLLRLLQMMTLLALVTVVVLTHRQGQGQHAALLTVPFLGVLYVGTVGADTLMNSAVTVLTLYPVACTAITVTAGLLILAALLAEALGKKG